MTSKTGRFQLLEMQAASLLSAEVSHDRSSTNRLFGTISLLFLVLLAACRPAPRRFPLSGEIIGIDRDNRQLIIHHQDIPNYMKSMTMAFAVKDPTVLDRVIVGDHIRATLVVTKTESWLEDIEVTEHGPAAPASAATPMKLPVEGQPVPDFAFTNQDGHPVHLAQFKGQIVLVTFIYTRCPLPDFCPRMTNNFLDIEKSLQKDSALAHRTRLLTITFDPEFDTPPVLRHYALSTTSIPAASLFSHWEFLAPHAQDLDEIARFFGLSKWKEDGQITHSLSTAIIAPDGTLFRWYHGNSWTPEELLQDTRLAAEKFPASPHGM